MPGAGLQICVDDKAVHDLDSRMSARYAMTMNITWRLVLAPIGLALFGGLVGCSPARGFCEAHADCEREFLFGIIIPDQSGNEPDSVDVCVANNEGALRSLRANEEPVCHKVADSYEIYMACIGNAFAKDNDGCNVLEDDCEDEFDDYADDLKDIDNNECSSREK